MSFKTISASSLLFGAGFSALCTLTMAQAQTIPYGSAHSAPGAVYSSGYYAVSPSISSTYYAASPTYSTVPVPVSANVPAPVIGTVPCPVYSDYEAYLYQLYGYANPSLTGGCAAGVVTSGGAVSGGVVSGGVVQVSGVSPVIVSAPAQFGTARTVIAQQAPARTFSPTPVSVTTTQETVVDGVEVFEEVTTPQAPAAQATQAEQTGAGFRGNTFVAPQSRFRASANVAVDLGYQVRHEIQPVATNLNFNGFSSVVIDRRNGSYSAQTLVEDPDNTLSKAYLNAQAPTHGPFVAEGSLVDQYGNSLEFYVDPDRANLPTTRVRNANPLVANGSVSLTGEFYGDSWSAGAAVGFDVSPILQQQPPALSTANVYVNTRFGTVTAGRGVGLPYPTRSYEVISGGGYSFADFGDYQASYVSPVVGNTRIGVVAGLQTRQVGATAEFQTTHGNNQYRAALYADTAQSVQGEIGYTRALGHQRFVGATAYAGRDGNGESFYGLQGNIDVGRHSLQANATRVKSNNLTVVYGSAATQAPVLGLEINDDEGFNEQDQLNLEYRYQAHQNVQLYANAELINHKYYGSTYGVGGGIRATF